MALNSRYRSPDIVIESLHRDFKPFSDYIDWVDVVEWVGEALDLVGAPRMLIEKDPPATISISNYRGDLPCDLHSIIQVREDDNKLPLRRSTDNFHVAYRCEDEAAQEGIGCVSDDTYKLNDSHIFTSFKTGAVEMSYRAFPVDERGFPKVPDNTKVIRACRYYAAERIGFNLWMQGKIRDAHYQKIEQDRDWAIGSADTASRIPTVDEMESWKNQFLRSITKVNEWDNYFKKLGRQEERKTHNSTNRGSTITDDDTVYITNFDD